MSKYSLQLTLENGKVIDAGEIEVRDGVDGKDGKDGANGKDGKDGLTTSVNGVEQVNGNIQLTPEHIGAARIVNGSYEGTGEYGSANPCVLNLGFAPKLVFLRDGNNGFNAVYPMNIVKPLESTNYSENTVVWSDTGISWYNGTGENLQFNTQGKAYHYVAIG